MIIDSWKTLLNFIKKRLRFPLGSPGFILYFIVVIMLVGSFGLVYDIATIKSIFCKSCDYDEIKLNSIIMNLTTIGLSLVAASTIELLFISKQKLNEEGEDFDLFYFKKVEKEINRKKVLNLLIKHYYDIKKVPNSCLNKKEKNKNTNNIDKKIKKLECKIEKVSLRISRLEIIRERIKIHKNFNYRLECIKRDISIFGLSALMIQFILWILANESSIIKDPTIKLVLAILSLCLGYLIWWISNSKNRLLVRKEDYVLKKQEVGGDVNDVLSGTIEGYN
ncbi:hypothetical protein QNH98_02035 [Myroides sp. mNGS23_01]|nr:hypothetical protein [Myroides sp. mNGS23_01]WHT39504.1 hypothetical protein QNH98_02035 [Myroides sp. mNGS23_01]